MTQASLTTTHANYSHDWWTPTPWLEWVTATFGRADWFDPCPSTWDGASDMSGLDMDWRFPAYCNHPGSRGSAAVWWGCYLGQRRGRGALGPSIEPFIWCAFSVEQLRHMRPSPLEMPGWLVAPRERVAFLWGGPTYQPVGKNGKPRGAKRIHGEPMKQPGNWTVFWSTVEPATPPVESIVARTGGRP